MSARTGLAARIALVLLGAASAARAGAPPPPPAAASGTGLALVPDASVLPPGGLLVGFGVDNRDRDPLGIDVFDGFVAAAVGLHSRLQAEARLVASRVVSLPEPPPLPASPLDLVVLGGAAVPATRHVYYGPAPYVDKRGRDRFDAWVPGDATLGLKARLADPRGFRPALAVVGEVVLPLARALPDLRSGSGTGAVDLALRLVGQWSIGRAEAVGSARYTRTGDGARADRVLRVSPSGGVRATDEPLRIADRVDLAAGARLPVGSRWAVVAEAETTRDVGARTPSLDPTRAADLRAGVQARFGRLRVVAAARLHVHPLASGAIRDSPLAGAVDVTDVAPDALAAWLPAGAGAAVPALRPGSHRVVLGAPAGDLPSGARALPESYRVRSEHQAGFTLALHLAL